MAAALNGTPQPISGGTSPPPSPPPPPPPPTTSSSYITDVAATQIGTETATEVEIQISASLFSSNGNTPLSGESLSFSWALQPYGGQELAGSGTTDAQGKATSPTISLSNAIGDDTYALTVSWPGSSAYSASSATISYTPPNSPPPPPPAPAPDATAISGLVAQVSGGMISTPMITVTGTLTDTVSGKGVATQTLQVTENSDFDSGVATTGSNGTFSFVLQGASPGTTYQIQVSFAGTSAYLASSATTNVTTPSSPPPPPPPASPPAINPAVAIAVAAGAAMVLGAGTFFAAKEEGKGGKKKKRR